MALHLVGLPLTLIGMPRHRWTREEADAARALADLHAPRSTRGKSWEEIYSDPAFVARKRERAREIGSRPKSLETRTRLSQVISEGFANGRQGSFTGRKHTPETKAKIAAVRRAKYAALSTVNQLVRGTQKYKTWRTSIFERDAYTCQQCGINSDLVHKRVRLDVHHKRELWQIVIGLTFEQAMAKAEVWDDANAITLCRPCHRAIPIAPYTAAFDTCSQGHIIERDLTGNRKRCRSCGAAYQREYRARRRR